MKGKGVLNKLIFWERSTKTKSQTFEEREEIPETIKQSNMIRFKSSLISKVNNFRCGQLQKNIRQWRKLTSDPKLLSIISGDKIEFVDSPRIQYKTRSLKFSDEWIYSIKDGMGMFLTKVIIKETCHEEKEFVSPSFISQKSTGGIRLNLT